MRLSRTGGVLGVVAAGSLLALGPQAGAAWDDLRTGTTSTTLVAAGTLVQLTLAAWVVLAIVLASTARTSRLVRHLAPTALRGALFVGAAGAVGALTLAPAHADQAAGHHDAAIHSVDGLQLPDRPSAAPAEHRSHDARTIQAPTARTAERAPRPATRAEVVVRRGDTLWGIAARHLPPDSTDGEIAMATRHWHESNRDVIGDDPDLILPGQHLTSPQGKDRP